MAINTHPEGYFAQPGKHTFYAIIYRAPHRMYETPARPDQILQADTWKEASDFAKMFAAMTTHQWVVVSALAPELPSGGGLEVAREEWWQEDGKLYRKPWRLGKETVADLSSVTYPEPIATERDELSFAARIRKIGQLMRGARPGETLADVVGRQVDAETSARIRASGERLKEVGDWSSGQGRLFPEEAKVEPRRRRPNVSTLDEYKEAHELVAPIYFNISEARNQLHTEGHVYTLRHKRSTGVTMARFGSYYKFQPLGKVRIEEVAKIDRTQMGSDIVKQLEPYVQGSGFQNASHWLDRASDPNANVLYEVTMLYEDQPLEAHEEEGTGWDLPLKDPRGAFTFRGWVLRNKQADVGTAELEYAVDEIVKGHPDLTANEARAQVESLHSTPPSPEETTTPQIGEWLEITTAIDWDKIAEKQRKGEMAKSRVDEIKRELQVLREAGAITKEEESRLLGVSVERLTSKQKEAFLARIAELEKQLEQLKKPPPTPEEIARQRKEAERHTHDGTLGPIPQEQVDLLFNTFNSIITRRTKREPFPTEVQKFDELVATMQRVKPQLKFPQLRIQVENLARQLATVATAGRIVLRRGQARVDELLETMLTRRLTPDEEDELRRLREGEEYTSTEVIEYEPPNIVLIAESGPEKNPIGTVIEATQPGPYPRVVMRTWEMANAQENAERLGKIGYKIRIEGEQPPSET